MNVTFMDHGAHIASSRYRSVIPAQELEKLGVSRGTDVIVLSKHGWNWDEATAGYGKAVMDVCTDFFQHDGPKRAFYLDACARADAVVASSAEMARRIKRHTGRDAWVIDDPYEERETEPVVHDTLLWHGHARNLCEVASVQDTLLGYPVILVTGGTKTLPEGCNPWTPQMIESAYRQCGMVVLPYHDGNRESTANRAINAIRRGRWPVCHPMPALAELGVWQGDIGEGVRWALANRDEVLHRLKAMQAYVRERFAPRTIALAWKRMLEHL